MFLLQLIDTVESTSYFVPLIVGSSSSEDCQKGRSPHRETFKFRGKLFEKHQTNFLDLLFLTNQKACVVDT